MEPDQRLPNGEAAIVQPEKVEVYLLNSHHVQNKGKARFFELAGYSQNQPERLTEDLKEIARTGRITSVEPTPRGTKYNVVGTVTAPNRREYTLLTVWIIETHQTAPRLVTAFPNKR